MMMALPDKFLATSPAPRPEVDIERRRKMAEERQALERSKRTFHKENAVRNNKIKIQTVMMILIIASGLFVTIFRSGAVYSAQKEYVTMQNETREVLKSNEALKANLIKASAIGELKEKSLALNLVENGGETLTVDLTVNHFGEEEMVAISTPLMERLFSLMN